MCIKLERYDYEEIQDFVVVVFYARMKSKDWRSLSPKVANISDDGSLIGRLIPNSQVGYHFECYIFPHFFKHVRLSAGNVMKEKEVNRLIPTIFTL